MPKKHHFPKKYSYILPLSNVFANESYVLTFTISNDNQEEHTMENDGGRLSIDGQYVELRDGTNNQIGTTSCNNDNTVCTITVSNGQTGEFSFFSDSRFSLFLQGHQVNAGYQVSANENILIQDYVESKRDKLFSIDYETRPNSKNYLQHPENEDYSNIDF